MESILQSYKQKLDDAVSDIKIKIDNTDNVAEILEDIKEKLSTVGQSNLKMLFNELKSFIEKNNPDFIKNNQEKWNTIIDKGGALCEYGLYVAPLDLLRNDDETAKTAYIGIGTFLGSAFLSKLFSKKVKLLPVVLASAVSAAAAYYMFDLNKDENLKNALNLYIDDAHDWINTALENMLRIFKDAK